MPLASRLRRFFERRGLATRLAAGYLGVFAVALVVLGVVADSLLGWALEENAYTLLRRSARDALQLMPLQDTLPPPPLVEAPELGPGIELLVLDGGGSLLRRLRGPGSGQTTLPALPPESLAVAGERGEWRGIVGQGDERAAMLLVRVAPPNMVPGGPGPKPPFPPPPGQRPGFVQVGVQMDAADAVQSTVRRLAAAAGVVVLLVAGAVGIALARLGMRPLHDLAETSHRLAAGDLAARAPEPIARDAVGELARAFNGMAAQLESSFATQRALVADASHELRTPLTALTAQLDVIGRVARSDPAEGERLLRSMRTGVARMSRLVDDLLTIARLDALGPGALRHGRVDLREIVGDVYDETRSLPGAAERRVHLDVDGPAPVAGDAGRLHQALLNLSSNALGHAPAGGDVWLTVRSNGSEVVASVRDSGPGVPPEHLPHIFDRFYRVDAARTRGGRSGTGLGLSIARAIVEAHGGRVTAANAAEGGAVFTVALPRA